jgi:hypothetical protein
VSPAMNWLQEGRDVGVTLDACHAVVVVGSDPTATSQVALGIAEVQSQHRRVAVGDMFGDAPPLQALIDSEDVHGLMDSFNYGVSLNRIAHAVAGTEQLFVMPSGTGPLDYEELFQNPRWRRLASGFRQEGALLLIAAPAEAANVRELVNATDGAVLVGDTVPMDLPVALSLAWVRPKRSAVIPAPGSVPPAQHLPTGVTTSLPRLAWRRQHTAAAGGIALTLLLASAALWFAKAPFASTGKARKGVSVTSPKASIATAGTLGTDSALRARRDSASRDSMARLAMPPVPLADPASGLAVGNAADSASAAAFALRFESLTNRASAILYLARKYKAVPAATFGIEPRTGLFMLTGGAYPKRSGADSLFQQLQASGLITPGVGAVVSVPFAFLVQANVPLKEASARRARLVASGQPVYDLRQTDSTANLYFGAFDSPQQAAFALPLVKKVTPTPALVYRIGRVY